MKFALCNEMFEKQPMAQIASVAARLGYHGIEIAPFTLGPSATEITAGRRRETHQAIEDHGLETVGLHWLFAGPRGLHMTTPDQAAWQRTRDYLASLLDLCSDLGGKILVLGSPKQRNVLENQTKQGAWKQAVDLLRSVVERAGELGLTICLEPLAPVETNFINTVAEGMKLVREVNHPSLKIHLDVKAMCSEGTHVPAIIRSVKAEDVGHFHVNDPNLYGPGMGDVDYAPIARAVRDIGYDKWLSVEPFRYDPDPETVAKKSIDCLRRFWP
ncbi:MAG TPA: sugar phosphate isomerase/epimerase family protein [Sedimentisphaerales bacterium]|nr:sugar phosphate isomerase/epimerase family protein [Sedimentisphaerales bacterium]